MNRATPREMQEVFSFLLAYRDYLATTDDKPVIDLEKFAARWRENAELRATADRQTFAFLKILEQKGLKLTVRSSKDLQTALEDLLTIPPRVAYDLTERPAFDLSNG